MNAAVAVAPRAARPAARSRNSRLPVACERMCSSSPICRPWAASANTSIGPSRRMRRSSVGPTTSRKNRSRSIATSPPTPNQSVSPGPSLSVECPRSPVSGSSTTQTGIDGEQMPVIGPTWACSLPLPSVMRPLARSTSAAGRSGAHPSKSAAATIARRCGSRRGPIRSAVRRAGGAIRPTAREAPLGRARPQLHVDAPPRCVPRRPDWPGRSDPLGSPTDGRGGRTESRSPPAGGRHST